MKRFCQLCFRLFPFVFFIMICSSSAFSTEPGCPGSDNPKADILRCIDFDSLSSCISGREIQCWTDNGLSEKALSSAYGFKIASGKSASGPGYLTGKGEYGSTGPGFTTIELGDNGHRSINLRYYIRFTDGYMSYIAGHGPGIIGKSESCTRSVEFEISQFNYHLYCPGMRDCGGGSFNLVPNTQDAFALKNNRWYLIEIQVVLDSQCDNSDDPFGCNGEARVWIDETLVLEYTNVNWGGVAAGIQWTDIWGPRSYYHVRIPKWEPVVDFDNFVVSKSGTYIGPATNENPRGQEDPMSPYLVEQGIEPFIGRHPNVDCSKPSGYLNTTYGGIWRNGAVLDSKVFHGGFIDQCNDPPSPDNSLKIELMNSNDGGGIFYERKQGLSDFTQQVLKGFIYLPSANDYSQNPILSGFSGYNCGTTCDEAQFGRLVAMTVNNGGWAVLQRSRPDLEEPSIVLQSTTPVNFDKWVEFELILWEDQTVSLMIDRQRIFNKDDVPHAVNWLFDKDQQKNGIVLGVIDFKGTAPFRAYYDDISIGSASFWSCDGWDNSSCPVLENDGQLYSPTLLEIKVN